MVLIHELGRGRQQGRETCRDAREGTTKRHDDEWKKTLGDTNTWYSEK